jgi:hypothetical protein
MNDQGFVLLSTIFKLAFVISLVFAALALRNSMRRRHAERLRREQDEEKALNNPRG